MSDADPQRVDRWLWSVRLYPTRSAATESCRGGHVRVNGSAAKPATAIRVGDRVTARAGGRERILEVVRLIDKRVGAPIAVECFVDHSPERPPKALASSTFLRDPSTGRPSKKERRQLDRFRNR